MAALHWGCERVATVSFMLAVVRFCGVPRNQAYIWPLKGWESIAMAEPVVDARALLRGGSWTTAKGCLAGDDKTRGESTA